VYHSNEGNETLVQVTFSAEHTWPHDETHCALTAHNNNTSVIHATAKNSCNNNQLEDKLWCPSINVDDFTTSKACELDLWPPESNQVISGG